MKKEKSYQVTSGAIILADGWVLAKNKKEAKKIWRDFVFNEMQGLSIADVQIHDLLSEKSRHYDHQSKPSNEEFDGATCITYSHLN